MTAVTAETAEMAVAAETEIPSADVRSVWVDAAFRGQDDAVIL